MSTPYNPLRPPGRDRGFMEHMQISPHTQMILGQLYITRSKGDRLHVLCNVIIGECP